MDENSVESLGMRVRSLVVEQHLFCDVAGGKIERADLLCSGFRARPGASA